MLLPNLFEVLLAVTRLAGHPCYIASNGVLAVNFNP